ncbi:MAG: hypothetical protein ACR2PF_11020 [Rhizobiaceae bacterium]
MCPWPPAVAKTQEDSNTARPVKVHIEIATNSALKKIHQAFVWPLQEVDLMIHMSGRIVGLPIKTDVGIA